MTNTKLSSSTSAVIPTAWTPPTGTTASTGSTNTHFTMPPGVVLSTNGTALPAHSNATAMDWMTTVFSNMPPISSHASSTTPPVHTSGTPAAHTTAPITLVGTHPSTQTSTGVVSTNGSTS